MISQGKAGIVRGTLKERLEKAEKDIIQEALSNNGLDKNKAIEELGLSRSTFYKKIKELGIEQ